jgi:serine/tyrosine/threonine adenylyltransferase
MSAMHSTQAIPRSHGGWRFDHSYTRLPAELFERTKPDRVCRPVMAVFNRALAMELGLAPEGLDSTCGAVLFSGNELPPGAEPIAQAYAGHQFGHFTMLGDGRAVLLGEQLDPAGRRWDVQLKGSGRTRLVSRRPAV